MCHETLCDCAIVLLVVTCCCCCSAESVISGPFPQNVIARINSTVEFTCSVNTSELTEGKFSLFGWNKDGVAKSKTSGVVKSSTLTLTVTEENLSGVAIQCTVIITSPLSQIFSGNATLITYGTIMRVWLLYPPNVALQCRSSTSSFKFNHQTCHTCSPAAMLWYYHGVLHPLQYSYTTLSQCGWPTLTVPVLLPSQCSIPPPLPSLSVETTSLPVQAHQSVISMCGVSLLSILLVVASLLTVLHLSQYHQVCSFWQHLFHHFIFYHISSSRWYIQCITYKWFTASITEGSIFNTCFCL